MQRRQRPFRRFAILVYLKIRRNTIARAYAARGKAFSFVRMRRAADTKRIQADGRIAAEQLFYLIFMAFASPASRATGEIADRKRAAEFGLTVHAPLGNTAQRTPIGFVPVLLAAFPSYFTKILGKPQRIAYGFCLI